MNRIVALDGLSASSIALPRAPAAAALGAALRIEIKPLSDCLAIRPEWSDLASRALEPNPFFGPDFALAAAQHLVAFRDAAAILVWQGAEKGPARRLMGLLPCLPSNRFFGLGALAALADPRILNGAPLIDRQHADAVLDAILMQEPAQRGLTLREIDLDGPFAQALRRSGERLGLSLGPEHDHAAPPPHVAAIGAPREALSHQGKVRLVEAGARSDIRDAVEIVLALEASGPRARSGRAILQDTREVGFVRAMTRGLARARQCRAGLLMLDEHPIAGTIVLGKAQRGWLYIATQDEAYAGFGAERLLLALMQQATPSRQVLQRNGLPLSGTEPVRLGTLTLQPQPELSPKHLAARAREALRRRGLRLRRAAAGG